MLKSIWNYSVEKVKKFTKWADAFEYNQQERPLTTIITIAITFAVLTIAAIILLFKAGFIVLGWLLLAPLLFTGLWCLVYMMTAM